MMRMVDLSSQRGPLGTLRIIDTATAVDCSRQARFRRSSFRALVECFVPSCCALSHHHPSTSDDYDDASSSSSSSSGSSSSSSTIEDVSGGSPTTTVVTGTFFGNRRGRVSFCLQDDSRSSTPLLLLEFGVPTAYLAREMRCGSLRIALKCESRRNASSSCERLPLYGALVWSMYCNGRKVGYAVRRQPSATDMLLLKLMRSVSTGAGVLPIPSSSNKNSSKCEGGGEKQYLMYLRASFQRVVGSADSEAFHIINPVGSSAQELSIFLLRSS